MTRALLFALPEADECPTLKTMTMTMTMTMTNCAASRIGAAG